MNRVFSEFKLNEDFDETAHDDDPHSHKPGLGTEGGRGDEFAGANDGSG